MRIITWCNTNYNYVEKNSNLLYCKEKRKMREKIHPEYKEAEFTCSCGNKVKTRATIDNEHIEICNKCHPFFTGKQKLVDSAGRVERFRRRYEKAQKK